MTRVPIDVDRLYENQDPAYVVWVRAVVERVAALQQEAKEAA